ncbi:hypothetical protein GUITHDRAFT_102118 [Guillardia theta CCMP2712]|uniref:Aspartate/glutamate/uridylate kinase domain-containing protein n=1 Tax=Guillardia theta (strain CCMP2712) TaxID=905079 RepID=L1JVI4_GUITC|nr:hypothetical protein GUITHDRAFT_102118 [Guillardia theta CCMP2712]EKX52215.1 hypothetical protein GUITHDRAFT_102118 [Guillardia theta CCMP2712]|eukprot:XP_005839195.1 hypothetical protein GUITHDRAFT_102118 [Guillardia theta CCMP2712]
MSAGMFRREIVKREQVRWMGSGGDEREPLKSCKRVVIKVGTAVVSRPNGTLALARMGGLVEEIADLIEKGKQVMLISSGAVGLGRERIGFSKEVISNTSNVVERQASAAAGQELLMSTYNVMFNRLGIKCAQVLITQGDFGMLDRYNNLANTLDRLSSLGVVPVINENDVVTGASQLDPATKGQVFTDNDMLAALVAAGGEADGVCMLTDVYRDHEDVKIGTKSTMGRGGMGSKIHAAQVATQGGVHCCIANGYDIRNIARVFSGDDIGTFFPARQRPSKHTHWLLHMALCQGVLRIRESAFEKKFKGAVVSEKGPQLEIADIASIEGDFSSKSPVILKMENSKTEIGRALRTFGSSQVLSKGDDLALF